jgi:peptidyl-dipeptidase Dcp
MTKNWLISLLLFQDTAARLSAIYSGGYSSGYYSYLVRCVLDTDALKPSQKTTTLFNPERQNYSVRMFWKKLRNRRPWFCTTFRGAEPHRTAALRKRVWTKSRTTQKN